MLLPNHQDENNEILFLNIFYHIQIQVSKRKSFSKSSKITVSKSATSFRKKLKRGRKYYIRIRAFTYYKVGLYTKNVAYGKWVKLKKYIKNRGKF